MPCSAQLSFVAFIIGVCGHGGHCLGRDDHGHDPGVRSLGHRDVRSLVRTDRPVGGSSHGGGVARRSVRGGVSGGGHGRRIRGRNRISTTRKAEYEPTGDGSEIDPWKSRFAKELTSIFSRSSRPMRLLCISW